MKFAISNIAWSHEEDAAAFAELPGLNVHALELAPGRLWNAPGATTFEEAGEMARKLRAHGLEPVAFQALLFGRDDLTLFGADAGAALAHYLGAMGRLAAAMGVRSLVFGSPRNRSLPPGADPVASRAQAVEFFRRVGQCYQALEVTLTLEPNPPLYQSNFLTTVHEAAAFVRDVDHPGIRLQIDAGALQVDGEDPAEVIARYGDLVAHVHASEPSLAPLSASWAGHRALAAALRKHDYQGWVSLEMKRPQREWAEVKEAIGLLHALYS